MADNSLYCKVCQIHLTGPVPAMQHYSSSKHIKKVLQQSSLPSGCSGTSFVGVAGAAITSSCPQGLLSTDDVSVDGIAESNHASSHLPSANEVVVIQPRDPSLPALQLPVVARPAKEFELDRVNGTGKCNLCGVDFSSVENANQHLAGQKHTKARLKWVTKQPAQCNKPYGICNPYHDASTISDCESVGQSASCACPASAVATASAAAVTAERLNSSSCDDSVDSLKRPVLLQMDPACQSMSSTDGAGAVEDNLRALSLSDSVPKTSMPVNSGCASGADCTLGASECVSAVHQRKRLCVVCNKTVDTEEMLRLHCQSPAHLKKASRLLSTPGSQVAGSPSMSGSQNLNISLITSPGIQTADNTLWFTCDVCDVRVNSRDQLEYHKRGAAHRKKLNASSGTDGDNTRWHSCTVCGKKLNSVPQLEVHMFSHGTVTNPVNFSSVSSSMNMSAPGPNVSLATAPVNRVEEAVCSAQQIISNPVTSSGSVAVDVSCCNQFEASVYQRPERDTQTDQENQSVASYSPPVVGTSSRTQQPTSSSVVENKSELLCNVPPAAAAVAVELDDDKCLVTPCPDKYHCCISHCILCNVHNNSPDAVELHVGGERHAKRKERHRGLANPMNPCGPQFQYFCEICMVPFNTIKDQKQHEKGQQHTAAILRCEQAPSRSLPAVKVSACSDEIDGKAGDGWDLTTSRPRKYQLELYDKAMRADSVCFLPTGTGKTMVAIMVISRMLSLNPRHNAIFIVDKVLLALQQITVIRRELGKINFKRWNFDTSMLEERQLRIAMLCGQREELKGSKIWDQDIIVVTAAYYVNLVRNGAVKWTFNCIAVFDEVHHCHSGHPYHELIQLVKKERSPDESRPKLLGLTASPASRESVASTTSTIRELLTNFCDSKIIAVEQNVEELKQFQSNSSLVIREVSYTTDEVTLKRELAKYFESCVLKLENLCSLELLSSLEQEESHTAASNDCHLNIDAVGELLEAIDSFKNSSNETVQVGVLIAHLKVIGQALLAVESTGVESAYRELEILQNNGSGFNYFASFDEVEQIGVSCPPLKEMLSQFFDSQSGSSGQSEPDANQKAKDINRESPMFKCLLNELVNWWDSQIHDDANVIGLHMALVLVRQRVTAVCLASLLSETPEMSSRQVRVRHVVGHGRGAADNGMPVSRQARVLDDISKHSYDVVVATSIAEEGIDLPVCELVVQLDAPDCVRALVQVRGRARYRDSRFVTFCRSAAQRLQLDELLRHEARMVEVVSDMVRQQTLT